jgi:hypothetical protein
MDLGGLFDGADVIQAGSGVFVEGGAGWASRSSEMGDHWNNRTTISWSKATFKIEKSGQDYKMTETTEYRSWKTSGPKDSSASCTFVLTKK